MPNLESYFNQSGFSATELHQILSAFEKIEIKKGEFFISEGKVSQQLAFIEKGFFHYFLNADGEEKTTYSVGENNFLASLISFLNQSPCHENIRALIDSEVWVISKKQLKDLQKTIPSLKDFYINLLEYQICCIDQSRLDSILLSPEERYLKMLKSDSKVIQLLPLQYLASILGITPRHLSRIRNKIR